MLWWATKEYRTLKDIARHDGYGWRTFPELFRLRKTKVAPALYRRVVTSIPWEAQPMPQATSGQWVAAKTDNDSIGQVFHIQPGDPTLAALYIKDSTDNLQFSGLQQEVPADCQEVRVIRTGGPKRYIVDYNPTEPLEEDQLLWLWGNKWISELEWDPKEWTWRWIGILPETTVLNYSTKRGYRVALRQDNHRMPLDVELEAAGIHGKTRAQFFNRIWHPHLPRKVSAMQWLILTEGLPVGAWRERIGLPNSCQFCPDQPKETLQHAFMDCPSVQQAWQLFRNTRRVVGLTSGYNSWQDINRGLLSDPPGPSVVEELQWDTAAAFTVNSETPWDILRAQLLWAIWCQKVAHTFNDEQYHLGLVLLKAWRNTVYCAMEAYKELFRHKRNEEKRHEMISCFQQVWTASSIFGHLGNSGIKWHIIPHQEFLTRDLGAWTTPPIRIIRPSPSPDIEAEFTARPDFQTLVQDFIQGVANTVRDPPSSAPASPGVRNQERENSLSAATPETSQNTATTYQRHTTEDLPVAEAVTVWTSQTPSANQGRVSPMGGEATLTSDITDTRGQPHTEPHIAHPKTGKKTPRNRPSQTHIAQRVASNPLAEVQINTFDNRHKPTSRSKAKCTFGPQCKKHHGRAVNSTDAEPPAPPGAPQEPAEEIDSLIREIDILRHTQPSDIDQPLSQAPTPIEHANNESGVVARLTNIFAPPPQSRPKVKCRFGPSSGRRHRSHPAAASPEVTPTQPAGSDQINDHYSRTAHNNHDPGPSSSNEHPTRTADRVTFFNPGMLNHSTLNRFALDRLGITRETLEERAMEEINEILREGLAERRLSRLFPPESIASTAPRILTQADCLQLFITTGVPTSSSLMGVYRWAAGLGVARFNFDWDFDTDNLELLNAYD